MDREGLEQRFRERLSRFRKEYFWFLWGALVISLAIALGVGFSLYVTATHLAARLFRFRGLIPVLPFFLVYAALFLTVGLAQYSRKPSESSLGDVAVDLSPWWWYTGWAASILLLLFFPALTFHFAHEAFTGRRLFASEEVARLAFEILAEGGERVEPDFLKHRLTLYPRETPRAVALLLEMKLLFLRGKGPERRLLRTMEGQALLEPTVS